MRRFLDATFPFRALLILAGSAVLWPAGSTALAQCGGGKMAPRSLVGSGPTTSSMSPGWLMQMQAQMVQAQMLQSQLAAAQAAQAQQMPFAKGFNPAFGP